MLQVPCLRQPDDTGCLPTCVRAVLSYQGREVEHAEVSRWCRSSTLGTVAELAAQGLAEQGVDAELVQADSLEELASFLDEGRPPIVLLYEAPGWSHAVVLCAVDERTVTVMDPRLASYDQGDIAQFTDAWLAVTGDTLLVGGQPARRAQADSPTSR